MKRLFTYIAILLFGTMAYSQEQWSLIKLSSGAEYKGDVINKNADIVVFRTLGGQTYQFPTRDIVSVEPINKPNEQSDNREYVKRFGVIADINSGVAFYGKQVGYQVGGDLLFGAANLLKRKIFLGGGIGVNAYSVGTTTIFVPLTIALQVPLMTTADAPFVGIDGGYGFAVKGAARGGFAGGLKIGWVHRFESQMAISLSLYGKLQQGTFNVVETIEGQSYTYSSRRLVSQVGLRFGVML